MPVYQPSGGIGMTGGILWKQTEIDLGPLPVYDSNVTIYDNDVKSSSIVSAYMSGAQPTGKDADEVQMDFYKMIAYPEHGRFVLYIRGLEGYLHDKFKIIYSVG